MTIILFIASISETINHFNIKVVIGTGLITTTFFLHHICHIALFQSHLILNQVNLSLSVSADVAVGAFLSDSAVILR